ncbi:hypothetical protein N9F36_05115 [Akkermansiaceae bacterium]|nr:hypothetical protein [Akkermansiaceae bacterium]
MIAVHSSQKGDYKIALTGNFFLAGQYFERLYFAAVRKHEGPDLQTQFPKKMLVACVEKLNLSSTLNQPSLKKMPKNRFSPAMVRS